MAEHITHIIGSGTDQTRKALIETLIVEIKITSPSTVVPVFRIPQPTPTGQPRQQQAQTRP